MCPLLLAVDAMMNPSKNRRKGPLLRTTAVAPLFFFHVWLVATAVSTTGGNLPMLPLPSNDTGNPALVHRTETTTLYVICIYVYICMQQQEEGSSKDADCYADKNPSMMQSETEDKKEKGMILQNK